MKRGKTRWLVQVRRYERWTYPTGAREFRERLLVCQAWLDRGTRPTMEAFAKAFERDGMSNIFVCNSERCTEHPTKYNPESDVICGWTRLDGGPAGRI